MMYEEAILGTFLFLFSDDRWCVARLLGKTTLDFNPFSTPVMVARDSNVL